MIKLFSLQSNQKKKEWLALAIVFAIAIAIRLHNNFSTEYMPGGNGAYYLIMVRSLLEKGNLIHADFPLLFWLESGIAFIVIKLGLTNFNSAIDMTTRIFDSVIPALSIIPAYLLTKKLLNEKDDWIIPILISALSILYYSFLILVSEFQKNSLGLFWLFWLLYFLLRVHEKASAKNIFGAGIFLMLIGLTHYGCIAVGVALIFITFFIQTLFQFTLKRGIRILFVCIFLIGAALGIMFIILPYRFKTFIQIPSEIFNNPVLFLIISRQQILSTPDELSLVLMNIIGICSMVLFIKKYIEIPKKHRSFYLSIDILLLFLASPFLSYEFAQRVYFISYLAAIPVLALLYNATKHRAIKTSFTLIISILILFSVIVGVSKPKYSNMNRNLYAELLKLKSNIQIEDNTIIVARHGMEYWSTWVFEDLAVKQEQLTPNYWRCYNSIYFLRQKKYIPPFGPAGIYGNPFPEPDLPEDSYLVYSSSYFDLYKAPNPPKDFEKYNRSKP